MEKKFIIPDLGTFGPEAGLIELQACSDGHTRVGADGVRAIYATGDRKVELICYADHTIAFVDSAIGYPAYYPVHPVQIEKPIKAVLMDLDGTSVRSEEFWVWIIQKSIASLLGDENFTLSQDDLPHVSGHSVSEHLQYCINKYCPGAPLEKAREFYFMHTRREMKEIMEGRGKEGAFTPSVGLKNFLLELKKMGVKIGLVTSGLYEKAYPEILSAFNTLEMGDPKDFYDCIISAGFPLQKGSVGTLGELSPKPHPWLYAETGAVGLNIPFADRNHVLGIEDSGAGVCAVRLAGYNTVGYAGGNINSSGTRCMCGNYCESFDEILALIKANM
mgnify:CR=1 FL=1